MGVWSFKGVKWRVAGFCGVGLGWLGCVGWQAWRGWVAWIRWRVVWIRTIIVRIQTIYLSKEKPPLVRRGLLSGCLVEDEPRTPFVTTDTASPKHANTRLVWHGFDLANAPFVG